MAVAAEQKSVLKCKITKLAETIMMPVVANVPVMIYGQTGIGKSSVVKYDLIPLVAKALRFENNYTFHDYRLSTKDIVDGTGMPVIDHQERATFWTRPAFIPKDDGKLHFFFLDEFGHASVQLQHLAYGLVNDRALGEYPLPVNNRVILASNSREDQGGDNKMLLPLCNRMGHVIAEPDAPGLIEKMKRWGWDARLIAYLTLRPDEIQKVSEINPAFPTGRSLEMLNKVLKCLPQDAPKLTIENATHMIVGEGFSRQFMTFLSNLAAGLPKIADILAAPDKAKVPSDPHYQYVVASGISKNIEPKNAIRFAEYLSRLMPDVRSMAAHDAMTRDPILRSIKELAGLVSGN